MKKLVLTLVVLLLALGCAFASVHKVKAGITPFGYQSITTSTEGVKAVRSAWTVGGGVGYEYKLSEHGFFGFNINAITSIIKDKKDLTDLSFTTRLGYTYFLSRNVDLYGAMIYGLDNQYCNKTHGTVQVFGPVVGARYIFNDKINAYGELQDLFSFSHKDGVKYANYRLVFDFGTEYKF